MILYVFQKLGVSLFSFMISGMGHKRHIYFRLLSEICVTKEKKKLHYSTEHQGIMFALSNVLFTFIYSIVVAIKLEKRGGG